MISVRRKVFDAETAKDLLDLVIKWMTENPRCKVRDVESMFRDGKPTAVVTYEERR